MKKEQQHELTIFCNEEFGQVRTLLIDEEPWFVGKDVAGILGYERATKAIRDHVDEEDVDEIPIQDSIGRMQNTPIINESGMYSLILSSKLSNARKFKHWVTAEVLPAIRKTGSYCQTKELPAIDQIKLIATGVIEIHERVEKVEDRITRIEESLDVLGSNKNAGKLRTLQAKVKSRAYQLVSTDINHEVLWLGYFISGIYANVRSYYDIAQIKQLNVKNYEDAIDMIQRWRPSDIYLQNRINVMQNKRTKNLLNDKKIIALVQYLADTNNGEINPF